MTKTLTVEPFTRKHPMKNFVGPALCALLVIAGCGGGGGGNAGGGGAAFGLDARVAPSGLQIPIDASGGNGQARPVNAFPNFKLPGPTFITGAGDGSNRLFLTDRNGVVWILPSDRSANSAAVLLDISDRVEDSTGEGGLLGLAFDPAFAANGYFYVSYVHNAAGARKVRLSQFRVTTIGGNVADRATERIVLEYDHAFGFHYGGWIGFGPEGNNTLYMSAGDAGNESDVPQMTNLFGKILRLRINPAAATYTAPSDNPFGNLVWATGFRNPWRCSFDRAGNGNLWCGDVGENDREEINRVEKGKDYGWPFFEGDRPFLESGLHAYSDFEPPVHQYDHSAGGAAVMGGYVYRGSAVPSLVGRYLYADNVTAGLVSLQLDGSGNLTGTSVVAPTLADTRSFGEDDAGEFYAVVGDGTIYRFEASGGGGGAAPMPATLSATGLFSDTAALAAAPFMIDYSVNAPFWSDGANKRRWFVLPGSAQIGFSADGAWVFPTGAITVKHFDLNGTRVETRVMVNRTDGWAGFTYRWRADQSDADLVGEGGASGTYGSITWNFPSRTQCMSCHTVITGRVLGLNARQFNGNHSYAATGRSDNQLRTLNHIGVFSGDIGAASQYGSMPNPTDGAASLQDRAKAYLDSNCSICHRPNGPTPVSMDLRYATSLADMNIVRAPTETASGAGAQRVVPGNHASSDLWRRVSSAGSNRMPPLGVGVVDAEAVQMLSAWIDGLQ